ncbi:MAG: hypothetical protein RLZZ324_1086, partial [Candidatus Parcubacteria bacterium]
DEGAVISCFATTWQLRAPLEDGMRVRIHGVPKVYAKSGKLSVNVDRAEPVGEGALRRAFELLRKKLDGEGLFAPERKRAVPRFPRRIGLIASRESAAYTDFLRILGNRWGGTEVLSAGVAVQGKDAAAQIVSAFEWFNAHPDEEVDVIVLTRGGGAFEDLHAFNDEMVVRAVFSSRIPVVVGVGHERDETLADFAADVRASTPSNAAEIVVPDRREILAAVDGGVRHMDSVLRGAIAGRLHEVSALSSRIEEHARRAVSGFSRLYQQMRTRFAVFEGRVGAESQRVDAQTRLLRSLDPRRPLQRGYAIVRAGGKLLRSSGGVAVGAALDIQLAEGGLGATVTEKR